MLSKQKRVQSIAWAPAYRNLLDLSQNMFILGPDSDAFEVVDFTAAYSFSQSPRGQLSIAGSETVTELNLLSASREGFVQTGPFRIHLTSTNDQSDISDQIFERALKGYSIANVRCH